VKESVSRGSDWTELLSQLCLLDHETKQQEYGNEREPILYHPESQEDEPGERGDGIEPDHGGKAMAGESKVVVRSMYIRYALCGCKCGGLACVYRVCLCGCECMSDVSMSDVSMDRKGCGMG
jgi:hypothetical protein